MNKQESFTPSGWSMNVTGRLSDVIGGSYHFTGHSCLLKQLYHGYQAIDHFLRENAQAASTSVRMARAAETEGTESIIIRLRSALFLRWVVRKWFCTYFITLSKAGDI